jgi:putative MATE family efflux protein
LPCVSTVRREDVPARTSQRVLALAWPVLAQQLLVLLVNLSDSYLAGHFQPLPIVERHRALGFQLSSLGTLIANAPAGAVSALSADAPWQLGSQIWARHIAYQSAQTTAHYLAWFITSYTVIVSVGSTALVARFVGAGDWRAAIRATNQSLLLAAFFGLLGTAIGLVGMGRIVELLQLHGEAAELAVDYLTPLFALLTFQMVGLAGIACLVGAGDTRTGFMVLGGVAVLNLPLAWVFFLGIGSWHGLGFKGIAVGTALSQSIGGLTVLAVLARGRAGLLLHPRLLWPDRNLIGRLLRISVPAAVDSLSLVVGQFWFLSLVNRLGYVASSAHGIALRWEALGYLSGVAFGTAAMTLVGQNLGAGRPAEASRSGWTAFGIGCSLMCAMGAIFFTFAPQMFTLFCPSPAQRPVVEAGVPVLRLVAFAMPAVACWIIFTYALRGAGDTRVPVLFTWIGFLGVRIPLAYLLTQDRVDLGPLGSWPGIDPPLFGAWLAMFADLMLRGAFFLHRFASGKWQTVRV